jgi:DNA-directed RNA polymerase subunit RPC12/RpoP
MSDLKFTCSECKQSLEIEASAAGERIDCPACGKSVVVPSATGQTNSESDGGLLGFIEQMLRRMIWGIFRFVFLDSPLRIWRLLVETFPWFIRLIRVAVYGLIWAALSFWPFLALRYIPAIKSEQFAKLVAFTVRHQTSIRIFGYVWAAVCLAGSLWGIAKWTSQRRSKPKKT